MNIEITARHFSASDSLKDLIYEKIKKIKRYNSDIMSCHVILTKENNSENVEIVARTKGYDFVAHENASIFERSLVNAIEKLSIQIKKQHQKLLMLQFYLAKLQKKLLI